MRILSRYVFREVLSSAILGTSLATFVIFLQVAGRQLFEQLVRSTASPLMVLKLFGLSLPPVLPLSIPFGVLVGILIGLGRLAGDGEITAMRAAGIPSTRIVPPVLFFSLLATCVCGCASLWLTPLAIRDTTRIAKKLIADQLTAAVQPRVFDEQFPNTILYIGDIKTGPVVVWRDIFLADLTPPEERTQGMKEQAEGPRVTTARQAIAIPDVPNRRLQLSLRSATTHEMAKDGVDYTSYMPRGEQALEAVEKNEAPERPFKEMPTPELYRYTKTRAKNTEESVESRIELHRRLALPFACMFLGMVGIPLGSSARKGGKSSGYIWAIFLAFFCYYLAFIALVGLAKQRTLPVEIALWIPNAVFAVAGLIFIARLELPGDRDIIGTVREGFGRITKAFSRAFKKPVISAPQIAARSFASRLGVFSLVDSYVLTGFLFYFLLVLSALVLLTDVFTFFDLLGDIVMHHIPMSHVFQYLFFLSPQLIYMMLPIGVLVGVLVTFGILTKNNEVTAFKACGVSLFRLGAPILLASTLLSVGLFAFDHYYVPGANQKQEALRNEIKGKQIQSYTHPEQKWIFGQGPRIYYYAYFDAIKKVMGGVYVYELDPNTFDLRGQIAAEKAVWDATQKTWIFYNGRSKRLDGIAEKDFKTFQTATFPQLRETPQYFVSEITQDKQMNYRELARYIRTLRQRGFDTVRLRVQYYKKFAVPVFALIMAMISIPFGFMVGNRGAMAGIGVSIGIAMAYLGIDRLFEQIGNVGQLDPMVAAWAPDAIFALAGMYFILRLRS
jgi:LPS export ABC transporter permease LptG/LPS export ABC transporter permease LptF